MKAIHLISIFLILLSFCSCETDPAKRNVRKFIEDAIEESIALDASQVDKIEIEYVDSLMSPIVIGFTMNTILKAKAQYAAGVISKDSLLKVHAECFNEWEAMYNSWNVDPSIAKKDTLYNGELRKCYRATVTFKNGQTRNPRVLMDTDGITPSFIESKVQSELDKLRRELESVTYL
jgi:hypothetical protein